MKTKHGIRNLGLAAMILLVGSFSLAARGAAPVSRTVELLAGAAGTIELDGAVADVLVANPAVADVGSLRANRLYIVGKAVGSTNILAFDDQGNKLGDISVHVSMDDAVIRDTIRRFFPNEKVEARTVRTNIVLSGPVSTPVVANQVRDLAARFLGEGQTVVDLMKVRGEQQVMLRVKILEAKRGILREYGFTPDYRTAGAQNSFNGIGGIGLKNAATPFASAFVGINEIANDALNIELRALEKDGLLSTLAEPNLTAISGETAGFLAGGEFPVPTGRDQDGNITIEFKQFGVSLNFTPTVMAKERISLQLSTEVSTQTEDGAVTLVNLRVPGLTVRRAQTTVQMGSGGTLMIAGLLKSEDVHNLNGLPGVQDVPVLGELFKSKSFSRDETELVILVTPYLVEPYAEPYAAYDGDTGADASSRPSMPVSAPPPQAAPSAPHAAHARPSPVQAVAAAPAIDGTPALGEAFIRNLRNVYGGNRVPQRIAGAKSFGYIVD